MITLVPIIARLIEMLVDVIDHVLSHSVRIAALEDQVAALQEHLLDREGTTR